jgi:hypothetical protein
MLQPEVVVLDVNLVEESGWLTCAKLKRERTAGRIVLVGETTARNRDLADFVGACTLIGCSDSLAAVLAQGSPQQSAAG